MIVDYHIVYFTLHILSLVEAASGGGSLHRWLMIRLQVEKYSVSGLSPVQVVSSTAKYFLLLLFLLISLPHRADKLKIRFRIINVLKNRLIWQLLIIYDLTF